MNTGIDTPRAKPDACTTTFTFYFYTTNADSHNALGPPPLTSASDLRLRPSLLTFTDLRYRPPPTSATDLHRPPLPTSTDLRYRQMFFGITRAHRDLFTPPTSATDLRRPPLPTSADLRYQPPPTSATDLHRPPPTSTDAPLYGLDIWTHQYMAWLELEWLFRVSPS